MRVEESGQVNVVAAECARHGAALTDGEALALLQQVRRPANLRLACEIIACSDGPAGASPLDAAAARARLQAVKQATAPRVCGHVFGAGDICWNCRDCQVGDDTCVICNDCFVAGDHEGHDTRFRVVQGESGGTCDCGDPDAWRPSGFCSRHGATDADPRSAMPAALRARVGAVCRAALADACGVVRAIALSFAEPLLAGGDVGAGNYTDTGYVPPAGFYFPPHCAGVAEAAAPDAGAAAGGSESAAALAEPTVSVWLHAHVDEDADRGAEHRAMAGGGWRGNGGRGGWRAEGVASREQVQMAQERGQTRIARGTAAQAASVYARARCRGLLVSLRADSAHDGEATQPDDDPGTRRATALLGWLHEACQVGGDGISRAVAEALLGIERADSDGDGSSGVQEAGACEEVHGRGLRPPPAVAEHGNPNRKDVTSPLGGSLRSWSDRVTMGTAIGERVAVAIPGDAEVESEYRRGGGDDEGEGMRADENGAALGGLWRPAVLRRLRRSPLHLLVRVCGLLPLPLRAATINLFTKLIGDPRFKQGLAVCTAVLYPTLAAQVGSRALPAARKPAAAALGPGDGAESQSVLDLTVQYLNREGVVGELTRYCRMMDSVVGGLAQAVVRAVPGLAATACALAGPDGDGDRGGVLRSDAAAKDRAQDVGEEEAEKTGDDVGFESSDARGDRGAFRQQCCLLELRHLFDSFDTERSGALSIEQQAVLAEAVLGAAVIGDFDHGMQHAKPGIFCAIEGRPAYRALPLSASRPELREATFVQQLMDLRYLLLAKGAAAHMLCGGGNAFGMWAQMLQHLQLGHAQHRRLGQHVEYGDDYWHVVFQTQMPANV
eukprot:g2793.t1